MAWEEYEYTMDKFNLILKGVDSSIKPWVMHAQADMMRGASLHQHQIKIKN